MNPPKKGVDMSYRDEIAHLKCQVAQFKKKIAKRDAEEGKLRSIKESQVRLWGNLVQRLIRVITETQAAKRKTEEQLAKKIAEDEKRLSELQAKESPPNRIDTTSSSLENKQFNTNSLEQEDTLYTSTPCSEDPSLQVDPYAFDYQADGTHSINSRPSSSISSQYSTATISSARFRWKIWSSALQENHMLLQLHSRQGWYILKCPEHPGTFGCNPIQTGIEHFQEAHGFGSIESLVQTNHFVRILDCSSQLAGIHNDMLEYYFGSRNHPSPGSLCKARWTDGRSYPVMILAERNGVFLGSDLHHYGLVDREGNRKFIGDQCQPIPVLWFEQQLRASWVDLQDLDRLALEEPEIREIRRRWVDLLARIVPRDVTEEACATFQVIPECIYLCTAFGGRADVVSDYFCGCVNSATSTCGIESECINRATKIECMHTCALGEQCQNQAFQRRQYADLAVIKTYDRGYGLRTHSKLQPDQFIIEYVGEVIDRPCYYRRKTDYEQRGLGSSYFMSLEDVFIDATAMGNISRFCNHSCQPNCYVEVWLVAGKSRAGIFASRHIEAGEELTFDYQMSIDGFDNVRCQCGENACSGWFNIKPREPRRRRRRRTHRQARQAFCIIQTKTTGGQERMMATFRTNKRRPVDIRWLSTIE